MKKLLLSMFWISLVCLLMGQTYHIQEGFSTTSLPSGWSGDVYFNSTANIGNLSGGNGAGFSATNKYLQIPAVNGAGTLTFWMKGSASSSDISFKVQKSVGGGAFSDIASYPKPHSTTSTQRTITIDDASQNIVIKFVAYDRGGNSIYLDDIQLTTYSGGGTSSDTGSAHCTNCHRHYGIGILRKLDRNLDGSNGIRGPISLQYLPGEPPAGGAPALTSLTRIFPNPGSDTFCFEYDLAKSSHIIFRVFNLKGQKIRQWDIEGKVGHSLRTLWDAKDISGNKVANGGYILQMIVDKEVFSKKIVVMN